MSRLALSLLGPFQLTLDGQPIQAPLWAKTQALLAYVVSEADRPHRREVLAGLLWPEQPDEAARHSLRQALHQLRLAIGAEAPAVLGITSQSVHFNAASGCSADVRAFTDLLEACERHAHRRVGACGACVERLQRAAALYRDHFLAGLFLRDSVPFEEWVLVKREQLARLALSALRALGEYHALRGEVELLEHTARRQIALDPFAEDAHRQVMCALGWSGQRNAALAHYETLRRTLASELDTPPERETAELRAQIAAGALVPPGPPALRNWPVRAQLSSFVGREGEMAQIAAHLGSPDVRLLTLLGPGGIGKTRLALQAAEQEAFAFRDGACWVPFEAVASPQLIASAVAAALHLPLAGPADPLAQLCDWLREKEMLLVLDNCERCGEAAPLVADLAGACPQLRILATSREPLYVRGEQRFPVPPLPLPDLARLPPGAGAVSALSHIPAVALFCDRARAIRPGFALTAENGAAVAEICVRLDGLPLPIELAAARIRSLSPQAMLARLTSRLGLLADGPRDLPPRQRTLRGTLDWSYDLLTLAEQTLFGELAVFSGGCTAEAVEAVCTSGASLSEGGSDPQPSTAGRTLRELLGSLLDKSLLQLSESAEDGPCYALLETVREYALDRLVARGSHEADAVRQRHAAHCLHVARAAAPELTGPQQAPWLSRLDREHGNLRAALGWALESGDVELAAGICGALWHFWAVRGHLQEGRRWLQQTRALAARSRAGLPLSLQAMLLNGEGSLAYYQGDGAAARQLYEGGLELSRKAEDRWGMAFALDGLGAQAASGGDYEEAVAYSEQSLGISREIDDSWLSGITLLNLGEIARVQGDCVRALRCYEEGLSLLRERGDQLFSAIALHDLGQMAQDQGQHDRARAIHAESLSLSRDLSSRRGIAMCLEKLADIAQVQARPARAARLLGAADALRRADGTPRGAIDHLDYERVLVGARSGLTEAEFAAAWEEGRAMGLEQTVSYALVDADRPNSPASAGGDGA
ncbi:MAG: tetratricopeptide repeat protein [Anaerolineae bacterium]|nr:tetratricopeptide repeat protein [Anaerolineae bacterium]